MHITRRSKKRINQIFHAKKRLKERFNLTFTTAELGVIRDIIQTGGAKLIEKQSNRVTKWQLKLNDIDMVVIYDNRTKVVVSVWPVESKGDKTSCQPTAE